MRKSALFSVVSVGLAVASFAIFMPSEAEAGPLDVYGFGARASAMGGAQVAGAEGPGALFYNPATLPDVPPQLTVGTLVGVNQSEILLHPRPGGYQVPDLGNDSPAVPTSKEPHSRRDTTSVPGFNGFSVSGITSLGVEGLRAGFYMSMPYSGFMDLQTHFADERERIYSNRLHYEFLGRSLQRFDIGLGLAYRLTPWMAIGVGGMVVPGAKALQDVFVEDLADQSDVDINTDIETKNNWGVLAGATFNILSNLRLGLAYRGEVFLQVTGENKILLGTTDPAQQSVSQRINWTPAYSPETFSGGIGWSPGRVEAQVSAEFERWSKYIDKHSQETNFHDTLTPRAGVEYEFNDSLDIRAGGAYETTPIPPQTGRTNYVGNDRLTLALGAGHEFELWGQPVGIDWALQVQNLFVRRVDKRRREEYPDCGPGVEAICDEVPDGTQNSETGRPYPEAQGLQTGNPGFPGYTSGGWTGSIFVDISWRPKLQKGTSE